jgi:DNA-directed RNA polymerase
MRVKSKSSLHSECVRLSDMPKVLDALNVVGRVGFRINHFVLDTISKVWEEGGGVGEIPSRQDSELPAALEDDILADPSPEAKQTVRYSFASSV